MPARVEKPPANAIQCPRCFGHDIVPSIPRGFLDWFFGQAERAPVMCRFCGKKFYLPPKQKL
jgi:hypothetical protein